MAKLIVKRRSEWLNWVRIIGIYLDNQKIGTIGNGETQEFEIPEGDHKLRVKIDWCGSDEYSFAVLENESHTIRIGAYKYSLFILIIEMLILVAHFIAKNMYGITYLIWFAVPFFLCSLYYITFGHNKYLRIEEDDLSLSF